MALSTVLGQTFKSPLRCLLLSVSLSRQVWKQKAKNLCHQVAGLRKQLQDCQRQLKAAQQQAQAARRELRQAEQNNQSRPDLQWQVLPGHHYSAEMIALCCQFGSIAGFRAAPKILQCISDALDLNWNVPSHDAVRNWTCRIGVALLQDEKADDWVWMIDHSVQLGKMCVLVALGIRHDQVPKDRPLRRSDMSVMAVLPSQSRNKEQVTHQLQQLADQLGLPLAILSDGASELKAATEILAKNAGKPVVHISDIKHKISCGLKKLLSGDKNFGAFFARAGQTAATIRQTELDHLQPPRRKDKCRFMNIHREIDWATMVLDQLEQHADRSDQYARRMREKLGWVTDFRESIQHWKQCRQIIATALKWSNSRGVYPGASEHLRDQLSQCSAGAELVERLRESILACYQENEAKLSDLALELQRLPCSTEVLESAFGSYKAMQRHHNRGTFTTLLAAFPTLFDSFNAESIKKQFARVTNHDLRQWLKDHDLTNSTQSRRAKAYAAATAA